MMRNSNTNKITESTSNDNLELRRQLLDELREKLITPPHILLQAAGSSNCSIFRVPASFSEVYSKHCYPHIVSIGPFHHGKPHLNMIQEHKYHYLSLLLARTNLTLEDLFQTLESVEHQAREAYSEQIRFHCYKFLEILVVDGCFVVELFRKVAKLINFDHEDPILSIPWILSFLIHDLIRLENQIPFVVLQRLFNRTKGSSVRENCESSSLVDICFEFFGHIVKRPPSVVGRCRKFEAKHLLDLYRKSFISLDMEAKKRQSISPGDPPSHFMRKISKLRRAGIRIRTPKRDVGETFLEVRFLKNGVIEMPTVTIDDFMSSFFTNCVVFELCHSKREKYFTEYTTFLDCLINTSNDVEYMNEHNVIENYLGTEVELSNFINSLGKEAAYDPSSSYLADLNRQVNNYYENNWNVYWATFMHICFSSPWTIISVLAAIVLLLLTILQTLYSIFSYYTPQN